MVSVSVLVLVGGVGRHLACAQTSTGAQWERRCGGICKALAQALARRLDPYAADVWHGAAPLRRTVRTTAVLALQLHR